jgi:hypothetical protein
LGADFGDDGSELFVETRDGVDVASRLAQLLQRQVRTADNDELLMGSRRSTIT